MLISVVPVRVPPKLIDQLLEFGSVLWKLVYLTKSSSIINLQCCLTFWKHHLHWSPNELNHNGNTMSGLFKVTRLINRIVLVLPQDNVNQPSSSGNLHHRT